MPGEDKNFGGSLVLDFRKWWRHVKTIYTDIICNTHNLDNIDGILNWQCDDLKKELQHQYDNKGTVQSSSINAAAGEKRAKHLQNIFCDLENKGLIGNP